MKLKTKISAVIISLVQLSTTSTATNFLVDFPASAGNLVVSNNVIIYNGISSGWKSERVSKSQSNVLLVGKWQSEWGPVVFNSDLTGYWNQGGGIGQIKDGTYNSKTRKLVFHYYQPWNYMNGTATMMLSKDGNKLSGSWTQQRGSNPPGSGGSGTWTMTRDPSQ